MTNQRALILNSPNKFYFGFTVPEYMKASDQCFCW